MTSHCVVGSLAVIKFMAVNTEFKLHVRKAGRVSTRALNLDLPFAVADSSGHAASPEGAACAPLSGPCCSPV